MADETNLLLTGFSLFASSEPCSQLLLYLHAEPLLSI